jgi:soluble lytic murein transglycosylase-like protein
VSLDTVLARIAELAPAPPVVQPAAAPATTTSTTSTTQSFSQVLAGAMAPTADQASSSAGAFKSQIDAAGARYGVDPALVQAVVEQESNYDPNATSGAGAQGLMQLMPSTAAGLGVTNPYDPTQAIDGGTRYLKSQLDRFDGDPKLALAAYNAGPGAVAQYGGVPPYGETQNYVQQVLDRYERIKTERSNA